MVNRMNNGVSTNFLVKFKYEMKRAERYRIFLSLAVFNLGPIADMIGSGEKNIESRDRLVSSIQHLIGDATREIDHISNSGMLKIGVLMPETSRQGAEAVTRRIMEQINSFCTDFFTTQDEYLVPVEISSFPDASGARSIRSYMDEFKPNN